MKRLLLILGLSPLGGFAQSGSTQKDTIPVAKSLKAVTVTAKPLTVERKRDKTVVNVEASVVNTGSTVLEVLERSPGVTVDKSGGITLNGKPGVLVMIDDRPTYLSGDDLNNLLSSMSASQIAKIELMSNPTAKYDAAGTAGIINIKTKKSNAAGFNGSFTTSYGQGKYPKNNNSLVLNYRKGKLNAFLTYSMNVTKYLVDLYAYRKYLDDSKNVTSILEPSSYFVGTSVNNTVKTGLDYAVGSGTTVGVVLTGTDIHRRANNTSYSNWLRPDGAVDSTILTLGRPRNTFKNGAINLNGRQRLSGNADLSVDLDYLRYDMLSTQRFENLREGTGGYDEVFRNNVPTTINIYSGKADLTTKLGGDLSLQAGVKSSSSHTDNSALYEYWQNQQWVEDDHQTNHFIYQENIQAAYATLEGKYRRINYQGGLRYEYTNYTGRQLGNSTQPASTVGRHYGGFFPNGSVSVAFDSLNSLTLKIGRRMDRPVFQDLNPFLYIINKYTFQTGNPGMLPQTSWNAELNYQYANWLTLGVSYNRVTNYFSQIFLSDTSKTILYYTQGNVGRVQDLGLSAGVNLSPVKWWTVDLTAIFDRKQFRGFNGNNYTTNISQLQINATNQFDLGRGYTAELSGFYRTRARNDIQELLYPTGQLSSGISKTVLRKKGTLKLSYRDMFYTNAMEGLTSFPDATEYFKLRKDTRVLTLAFTYRFGRSYKVSRHEDGASEEKERAGNG